MINDEIKIEFNQPAVFLDDECKPAESLKVEFVKFKDSRNANLIVQGREVIFDKKDLVNLLEFLIKD
jgi:hypothetical protein